MAKKGRSPSYPAIDLKEALKLARTLYGQEKQHAAPVLAILGHWNYSPKSSGGRLAFAALKKFGLLDHEGRGDQRKGRLTDLAVRIIIDERPDSEDKARLIREAAEKPPIHAEMLKNYSDALPSDVNVRFWLRSDKSFTDKGAKDFLKQFKATFAFARPAESDSLSDDDGDSSDSHNFSVGDYVQWEQGGVLQFPEGGRKIISFYDSDHAQVEGTTTGIPVAELVSGQKPALLLKPPLNPAPGGRGGSPMVEGNSQDVFTLESGQAVLQWPALRSVEEYEDFESWINLVLRKAKRAVERSQKRVQQEAEVVDDG